jgi:polyisoprenoid-binding protein YceI
MIRKHYALLALTLMIGVGAAEAATYSIDAAHSSVGFVARHMVVSKVRGHFDTFEGSFDFTEGQPATWKAQATIQAASVNTGNEKRDEHLRSPDFFAAEEFPTLTFSTTGVEQKGDTYLLKGDLTMRGVTKPIVLTLEYFGSIKDPWGNDRAGFSAKGTVSRKEFGLSWNNLLETGGAVASDEIQIEIEVEGVHKP